MSIVARAIAFFRKKRNPIKFYKELGAQIGNNCRMVGNVDFGSEPYLVKLGDHVSITSSSFITHDGGVWVFREEYPSIDVIKPIKVGIMFLLVQIV